MNDDILDFYISQGLEVKLIRKDTSSSSSSTRIPYKHEVYSVGSNILFIKFVGQIKDYKPYEDIGVDLFELINDFLKTHQNVLLIQNCEDFYYMSSYGRKKYSDWLESVAVQFESIVFYKASPLLNIVIASTRLFNKKLHRMKSINSFHEFEKFHLASQKSRRSIHEDEILGLLEDSPIKPLKKWTHNIDDGRLTQETKLIDENIIILDVKGESVSGDVKIVGVSKKIMKPHIPNHHDKFFLLFDVKNFKNQSIKRQVETYNFLESIIDDVHAVIICNASTQATVSAKTIIATKAALKNKIFFKESLKDAIAKALEMKGVEVIRNNNESAKKKPPKPKWYKRIFPQKKTQRIYELELELDSLKEKQEQHNHNTLLMIGRILWGKSFVQIPESDIHDEESREIYSAIEILHKELKDVALSSEETGLNEKEAVEL